MISAVEKIKQGKRDWEHRQIRVDCNEKVNFETKHRILSRRRAFQVWVLVKAPKEQGTGCPFFSYGGLSIHFFFKH